MARPRITQQYKVKRLNVSLTPDLLERIDAYCDSNALPRSSFFRMVSTQYLDAVDAQPSIQRVLNATSAVLDGLLSGSMSVDEAQARFGDIQSSYDALSSKVGVGSLPK